MSTSKAKRAVALASAVGMLTAFAATTYENDFVSRQSSRVLPRSAWNTCTYRTGLVANNVTVKASTLPSAPYDDPAKIQDGWVECVWNQYDLSNPKPSYDFTVQEESGLRYLRATSSVAYNTRSDGAICHAFGRRISSGILRLTFDVWVPDSWGGQYGIWGIGLISQENLNRSSQIGAGYFGCKALGTYGIASQCGNTTDSCAYMLGNYAAYDKTKVLTKRSWYRVVGYANYKDRYVSFYVYPLGTEVPTFDTEPGDLFYSNTWYFFGDTSGTADDPTVGIAVFSDRVNTEYGSSGTYYKSPALTNIRVEWCESGKADEYAVFYENDFKTRKMLPQDATPATQADYSATTAVATDVFSDYEAAAYSGGMTSLGYASLVYRNTQSALKLDEVDGWRRLYVYKDYNDMSVVDNGGDAGKMARFMFSEGSDGMRRGFFAHSVGEKITSGKVRIVADLCTPPKWSWSSQSFSIGVTSQEEYNKGGSVWTCGKLSDVGFMGDGKTAWTTFMKATGTDVTLTASTWYRVSLTVDLDKKTQSSYMQLIGSTPVSLATEVTSEKIAARTDLALYNVSATNVYAVLFEDCGAEPGYADNIRVWKDWDGEKGTLIYENDFETRTRYNAAVKTVNRGTLGGVRDVVNGGADGWVTRGLSGGVVAPVVSGGANPCVAFLDRKPTWAVQRLWRASTSGKMSFSVDMRSPKVWRQDARGSEVRQAFVLGGDDFWQGVTGTTMFTNCETVAFGFMPSATENARGTKVYRTAQVFAAAGDGAGGVTVNRASSTATVGNWYRFKGTADISEGTYSLKVYDMGATQPTGSTADGTLVATFNNLAFRCATPISSVGLAASGADSAAWSWTDNRGEALFDNIELSHQGLGMILSIQ